MSLLWVFWLSGPAEAADRPAAAPTADQDKKKKPPKKPPAVPVRPGNPSGTPTKPAPSSSPAPRPAPKPAPPTTATPHPTAPHPESGDWTTPPPSRPAPATSRTPPVRPTSPEHPLVPAARASAPTAVHATAREVLPARTVPTTHVVVRSTRVHPLYASTDHRFARPDPYVVIAHPVHPVPVVYGYRPYWTHWYVHPYWRWTHATVVVVDLGYDPDPWHQVWIPPSRAGWAWVPGHSRGVVWVPGHWAPAGPPPVRYGVAWTYVPGWWVGPTYMEGFYRRADRSGWQWVDGYYLDDGSFVPGYWAPTGTAPRSGYVWEQGYWDGQYWVEGFWRPSSRPEYRWVSSWLDQDGIQHAGYWEPVSDRPGQTWVPGWFDGDSWVEGYWVTDEEYKNADPDDFKPDEGWDDRGGPDAQRDEAPDDDPPAAIPVDDN